MRLSPRVYVLLVKARAFECGALVRRRKKQGRESENREGGKGWKYDRLELEREDIMRIRVGGSL